VFADQVSARTAESYNDEARAHRIEQLDDPRLHSPAEIPKLLRSLHKQLEFFPDSEDPNIEWSQEFYMPGWGDTLFRYKQYADDKRSPSLVMLEPVDETLPVEEREIEEKVRLPASYKAVAAKTSSHLGEKDS
jgi:hypothetical protein